MTARPHRFLTFRWLTDTNGSNAVGVRPMDDTRSRIAHLYRRAGFGARPDELDAAAARGYQATVDSLLARLSGPDPTGDKVAVPTLVAAAGAGSQPQDPAARMAANLKREMAVSQAD